MRLRKIIELSNARITSMLRLIPYLPYQVLWVIWFLECIWIDWRYARNRIVTVIKEGIINVER